MSTAVGRLVYDCSPPIAMCASTPKPPGLCCCRMVSAFESPGEMRALSQGREAGLADTPAVAAECQPFDWAGLRAPLPFFATCLSALSFCSRTSSYESGTLPIVGNESFGINYSTRIATPVSDSGSYLPILYRRIREIKDSVVGAVVVHHCTETSLLYFTSAVSCRNEIVSI
jgi:hypothetical protein